MKVLYEKSKKESAKKSKDEKKTNVHKVTKKEIKTLLKTKQKNTSDNEGFFSLLFRKIQFRTYRKRNKKLINFKARS